MRKIQRAVTAAAGTALLLPLAAMAQAQQTATVQPAANVQIAEIRILVSDADTRQELGVVRPGETIEIAEGTRIRMGLQAVPTNRNQKPFFPRTNFRETRQGGAVFFQRVNQEGGSVVAEVVRPKSVGKGQDREVVHYEILDAIAVPANLKRGHFTIEVDPDPATGPIVAHPANRAHQLTNLLYRAILLRDLDEAGARGTVESIERGGYNAVVDAARTIAGSEESRIRIYERNVTNEQRLLALYRDLLGLESAQIDRDEWEANLRRIADGRIVDVVEGMVRSETFRLRHGFGL